LGTETVTVQIEEDDLPTADIMQLVEQGGAFAWLAEEQDVYSVDDLKVRYRWDKVCLLSIDRLSRYTRHRIYNSGDLLGEIAVQNLFFSSAVL
jgi:hypothetical protein